MIAARPEPILPSAAPNECAAPHQSELLGLVARELEVWRQQLERSYGWSGPRIEAAVRGGEGVLTGMAISNRAVNGLLERLSRLAPQIHWTSQITPLRSERWVDVPRALVRLYEAAGGDGATRLSSEWHSAMGPVELLSVSEGSLERTLVRALDGTVGWMDSAPTYVEAPPGRLPVPVDNWSACEALLLSFVDVPYLLGGTTRKGLDCTGLVQHCYFHALGLLLPRHSTDQLNYVNAEESERLDPGDLIFAWTEREGHCHVGVALGDGCSIVHASLSRQQVVVDPMTRFLEGSFRMQRLTRQAIVERGVALAGSRGPILGWPVL